MPVINDLPEKYKDAVDRSKDKKNTKKKRASRVVRVATQTEIPPRAEGIVLVAAAADGLVQIEPLLKYNSTQAWTIATGIIDGFPSFPFNVIVLNAKRYILSLAKHDQMGTALAHPLDIIQKKCDEPSTHTPLQPLHQGVNLAHYQLHVDRLQQMANHE